MANVKITELPEATTAATTDLLEIVSDPGGTPVSKKISIANISARAYGSISVATGSTAEPTVDATARKIVAFTTEGLSLNVTSDATDNSLRADIAGTYSIHIASTFSGTANKIYRVSLWIYDDSAATYSEASPMLASRRKIGSGGDEGSPASPSNHYFLDTNDKAVMYQEAVDGGTDLTFSYLTLSMERVDI